LIEKHSTLPKGEFLLAIKLVLQSTYFTFNNNYYKQTFEAPMGFPLSPIVVNFVLQKLEIKVISKLSMKLFPIFYYRFVEDIAIAAPYSCLNDFIDLIRFILVFASPWK